MTVPNLGPFWAVVLIVLGAGVLILDVVMSWQYGTTKRCRGTFASGRGTGRSLKCCMSPAWRSFSGIIFRLRRSKIMRYKMEARVDYIVEAADDASAEKIVRASLGGLSKKDVGQVKVGHVVIKAIGESAVIGPPPKPKTPDEQLADQQVI